MPDVRDPLLDDLARAWRQWDPMPADLPDRILTALALADLDDAHELLTLTTRSDDLLGARSSGDDRTLIEFQADGVRGPGEGEPRVLQDVLGGGGVEPVGPHDLPQHRGEGPDEVVEGPRFAGTPRGEVGGRPGPDVGPVVRSSRSRHGHARPFTSIRGGGWCSLIPSGARKAAPVTRRGDTPDGPGGAGRRAREAGVRGIRNRPGPSAHRGR